MTYKITITTDAYHAKMYPGFVMNCNNTKGVQTVASDMTLKEAQTKLLERFREDTGLYYPNWGLAVANTKTNSPCAYPTFSDGTRAYHNDIFDVKIEPEA